MGFRSIKGPFRDTDSPNCVFCTVGANQYIPESNLHIQGKQTIHTQRSRGSGTSPQCHSKYLFIFQKGFPVQREKMQFSMTQLSKINVNHSEAVIVIETKVDV